MSTQNQVPAVQASREVALNEFEQAMAGLIEAPSHDVAVEMQQESGFLPYMRMVQGNNKLKDPPHDLKDGCFTLHPNKNEFIALDRELDIMFLSWRPLAMNTNGAKPQATTEQRSDEFKEWRLLADDKDEDTRHGYQWGYEFLVWLGEEGCFATFWCNNKSMRRFGRYEIIGTTKVPSKLGRTLTIWGEKIEDKQEKATYRYVVIKHRECNTAFTNVPALAEVTEVIAKFKEGRNQQQNGGEEGAGVADPSPEAEEVR